jgi:ribosomal protein S8
MPHEFELWLRIGVRMVFLHIGGDEVISLKNIIAIMDMDTTTISKDTKEFLRIAEEEGFIESISQDLPKSFIITEVDKKSKIYLSPISSSTLQKRAGYIRKISNVAIFKQKKKF